MAGQRSWLAPPDFAGACPHRLSDNGIKPAAAGAVTCQLTANHTRPQIQPIHENAGALAPSRALSHLKVQRPQPEPGALVKLLVRMVPLCVKAPGSPGLVEFLEHGGAQLVQGQPVGLDQEPDRAGAVVGEAYMDRLRRSIG